LKHSLQVAALVLFSSLPNLHAATKEPLTLIKTQPVLDVQGGDFDHFAVDLKHNRLFVTAEEQNTIEVFNLKTGEHIQTGTGVKAPHKLVFLADKNELWLADGGSASCLVLDATDLHVIARIPLEANPDGGVHDPKSRIFYVGHGGHGAKAEFSYVSAISVDQRKELGRVRVEANTIKQILLDRKANKLYVNLRDKGQIAIIDVSDAKRMAVAQTWSPSGLKLNAVAAFDFEHHRMFVGGRKPGTLLVLNSEDGSVIQTLDIVETSDEITYDARHRRIYITGSNGLDVIAQKDPDHYEIVQKIDTLGGKTSEYVPALKQFYVVHTKSDLAPQAGLQVFKVNN
jgi:DNA-binding beta-propeller fold protein YncE